MASQSYEPVFEPEISFSRHIDDHFSSQEGLDNRKSFQTVDIHEVHGSISPDPSVENQTQWSESASERSSLRAQKPHDEKSTGNEDDASSTSKSLFPAVGSWNLEIISILVSCASVAGIIGVLAHFSGRALPDWPLNITLNTLIALLATIANANLLPPIQSGLSQLKWVRFKNKRAPLTDMEAFDDASRGTWGALRLLAKRRGGFLGSSGAIIAIVALALGPFAQQVATYRTRTVLAKEPATIPTALNYTGVLPGKSSSNGFVPILPLKSAVYYGLFSEANAAANLPFNCPTGNCTWPEFTTLAVCSSCTDLTPLLSRYCEGGTPQDGNFSGCGWQVPQGQAKLNTSADVFSMTSLFPDDHGNMPYTTIMKLIFMGTEAQDGPPLNYNPWATQCTLEYCLQDFHSYTINGILAENITSTTHNNSVIDISNNNGTDIPVVLSTPKNDTYIVSLGANLGIRSWFETIFTDGSANRNASYTSSLRQEDSVIVNLTVGISSGTTYFESDIVQTFYWDYYEHADGLPKAMDDLATSMTVAFRSFIGGVQVNGQAFGFETYVHVRWGWIALPVTVVLFTALFLVAAIWRSRSSKTQVWKSSTLAVLFHGLDEETRSRFRSKRSLGDKKKEAKGVTVQLDEGGEDGSLLRFS